MGPQKSLNLTIPKEYPQPGRYYDIAAALARTRMTVDFYEKVVLSGGGGCQSWIFFGFWNSSPIGAIVPSDPDDVVSIFFLWEKSGLRVVEASQTVAERYEKSDESVPEVSRNMTEVYRNTDKSVYTLSPYESRS